MQRERIIDAYLVAAARTGETWAFERLVERWHPLLIAHASRLTGQREWARDVVQNAWVDIARGIRNLRDERAFPAWAYRITSRRCAAAIRSAQRNRAVVDAVTAEPSADCREAAMETADAAQRLRAAIRLLPPAQRAAIALFHFEELSVAEVAVALDVPTGTVKTRLMHARRTLRAALEGGLPCKTPTR